MRIVARLGQDGDFLLISPDADPIHDVLSSVLTRAGIVPDDTLAEIFQGPGLVAIVPVSRFGTKHEAVMSGGDEVLVLHFNDPGNALELVGGGGVFELTLLPDGEGFFACRIVEDEQAGSEPDEVEPEEDESS